MRLSKILRLPLQMESWGQCVGCIFFCSRGNCIFFLQFPFWYFGIVQIWPMHHSLETRIWFLIILLPLKESLTLFQIWVSCYTFNYFAPVGVIENRFTKINFKCFNGNCDSSSCPGWWILFLYALPHKGLGFWKKYLWASLSLHFHIVLK